MSERNQQQRLAVDAAEHEQQSPAAEHRGATDLSQVLNAVTAIMAESERRQNAALTDMQQRIAEISSSAVTARNDIPSQYHHAFQRIEDAMSHLAKRINAGPDVTHSVATERAQDGLANDANDTSAALTSLASLLGSELNRPVPVTMPTDEAGYSSTLESAGNPDEPWDEATAEQLTQLYERGEAGLPPVQPAQAIADPSTNAHRPAAADAPKATSVEDLPPQAAERNWMADQFTKLAAQIEHSLSQTGKTEITLETVAQRLAELEGRFDDALEQLVTRSDVSSLRDIEACIVELTAQFESSQAELARVQGIEWQLQSLASRLSEERVSAMTDAVTGSQGQPDFAALAEAIGQQIAEQSNAHGVDVQAETVERTATELNDVKGLLNNLIAEQRSEGKETIDRLEAMQQAMVALLERVEKIETVEQTAPLPHPSHPHAPHTSASFPLDGAMHSEPLPSAPAPAGDVNVSNGLEVPPHLVPASTAPEPQMEVDKELAIPQDAQQPYADDQRAPAGSVDRASAAPKPDRQNFMAEARRAAAKANARAEVQTGNDDDDSQLRSRKSQGTNPSDAEGESQPRASRIRLLVAAVAIIAIGVSATNLLVGIPLLSFGGQTPAAKSAPVTNPAPAQPTAPANPTTGSNRNGATTASPDAPRATAVLPPALSSKPQLATRPSPASLSPPSVGAGNSANGSAGVSTRLSRDLPPALVGPLSLRLAAANGNPSAMFEVGTRFAEGRGIQQDFKQAIKWYTRAATKGFALGQYRLAALYERGLGGTKDLARAKIWYERAARQGNVKSMHNLAVLTAGSRVGSADYAAAAEWFTQAAERGLTDSQFNLAILHENGLGVSKDLKKAYHWFGIAARSGDQDAKKRQQTLRAKIGEESARTADGAIANWRHRATNRMANDARFAGSQWQQQQKAGKTNG